MPSGYMRCQYVDENGNECDIWYPAADLDNAGNSHKMCQAHRQGLVPPDHEDRNVFVIPDQQNGVQRGGKIPRTVTVLPESHITKLNEHIAECLTLTIPELVVHIQNIEEKMKDLARQKQAAVIAKRNLEDRLTEDEREALRQQSNGFKVQPEHHSKPRVKKNPEEKAKGKTGFSAWAARLGMNMEELMVMDEDELTERIAKYKASRG